MNILNKIISKSALRNNILSNNTPKRFALMQFSQKNLFNQINKTGGIINIDLNNKEKNINQFNKITKFKWLNKGALESID